MTTTRPIMTIVLYLTVAAATTALLGVGGAEDPHHAHGGDHFDRCAQACAASANECGSCYKHCAALVAGGSKDHVKMMRLCNDCQLICSTAAALSSRRGPLSVLVCQACAEACNTCAVACEKFPGDKHMTACAKHCRKCAKACRAMITAEKKARTSE